MFEITVQPCSRVEGVKVMSNSFYSRCWYWASYLQHKLVTHSRWGFDQNIPKSLMEIGIPVLQTTLVDPKFMLFRSSICSSRLNMKQTSKRHRKRNTKQWLGQRQADSSSCHSGRNSRMRQEFCNYWIKVVTLLTCAFHFQSNLITKLSEDTSVVSPFYF